MDTNTDWICPCDMCNGIAEPDLFDPDVECDICHAVHSVNEDCLP